MTALQLRVQAYRHKRARAVLTDHRWPHEAVESTSTKSMKSPAKGASWVAHQAQCLCTIEATASTQSLVFVMRFGTSRHPAICGGLTLISINVAAAAFLEQSRLQPQARK